MVNRLFKRNSRLSSEMSFRALQRFWPDILSDVNLSLNLMRFKPRLSRLRNVFI